LRLKKSATPPDTPSLESVAADCAAVKSVVEDLLGWQSGRLPEGVIERMRARLRREPHMKPRPDDAMSQAGLARRDGVVTDE
jgi:hypothetical protein